MLFCYFSRVFARKTRFFSKSDARCLTAGEEYLQIAVAGTNGIDERLLVPTGIPIKRAFYKSISKEKAKDFLGLPKDKQVILLMCGSIGCGPIYKLGKKILDKLPEDAVSGYSGSVVNKDIPETEKKPKKRRKTNKRV